jgi:hypothetical protein
MSCRGVRHKQNTLIRHPERLNGNQKFDLVGYLLAVQTSEGSRLAGLRCFATLSMTGKYFHKFSG